MRVFVLGGSGYIGSAVVAELGAHGHEILALARSDSAASRLRALGASVLAGDLLAPDGWVGNIGPVDAVIQMADTFSEDMAEIEQRLFDHLLPVLSRSQTPPRFLYTGGCWLYGTDVGHDIVETSPLEPPLEFEWMVHQRERLLATKAVATIIVHPAMVYDRDGGVLARFIADAEAGGPVSVVGGPDVSWPLVHRDDLAVLYRLALEKGQVGRDYHGVSESGLAVGVIAQAIASRFGVSGPIAITSVEEAMDLWGSWAKGLGYHQRMTGTLAQRELGWWPRHGDLLAEQAQLVEPA